MVAATDDHAVTANARVIEGELAWLGAVIAARFAAFGGEGPAIAADLPAPPDLADLDGPYEKLIRDHELGTPERLVLALALAPHLAPAQFDAFLLNNEATGRRFTEFGGWIGQSHSGFLPTLETAMFLLAGSDTARRIALDPLFGPQCSLVRQGILLIEQRHPEEPPMSRALRLSALGRHALLHGGDYSPVPGGDFPATPITTLLDWADLVLDSQTLEQVEEIGQWITHSTTLMQDWGLARRLKPGYRCLFHGSPGTGKTLTACLLGKRFGRPVYRVDISRLVSKWIGETEKNLAALFDQAEDRDWILFFDEADALFGKRTESQSANDRAANQQIAYLLQRLEEHPGLAILATNQLSCVDEAVAQRFQNSICFPTPDAAARRRLWEENFTNASFALASDVDFTAIAEAHKLAGGAIINVLRHACLKAVQRSPAIVEAHDLLEGIKRELREEGRYANG